MAKLTHQSNFNNAAFGQHGSMHLDDNGGTAVMTCPTGKVFVAITMLEDVTFDASGGLEAHDPSETSGSFGTNITADNDRDGKGDKVTASTTFPKGLTIYGEWTQISVATGKLIAYWGPAN